MISLNLWKIYFIWWLWWKSWRLHSLPWHLSLFSQTGSSLFPPQTLTNSQTGQTQFCLCIHIVHPLRSPFPLIVTHIPCLSISIYFLSLHPAVGVSTFSCCSLCYVAFWFVLSIRSSTSLDHVQKKLTKNKQTMPWHSQTSTFTACFRNISPMNSGVHKYFGLL